MEEFLGETVCFLFFEAIGPYEFVS